MIVVGKRLVSYETRSLTTLVELCFICEWVKGGKAEFFEILSDFNQKLQKSQKSQKTQKTQFWIKFIKNIVSLNR